MQTCQAEVLSLFENVFLHVSTIFDRKPMGKITVLLFLKKIKIKNYCCFDALIPIICIL